MEGKLRVPSFRVVAVRIKGFGSCFVFFFFFFFFFFVVVVFLVFFVVVVCWSFLLILISHFLSGHIYLS